MASKKAKGSDFFQRKMKAFRSFGKASYNDRPQLNFKNYLLEKRKLNMKHMFRDQSLHSQIDSFELTVQNLPPTPSVFSLQPYKFVSSEIVFVDTDESFEAMMVDLGKAQEISLDLEMNIDHSYYGMTCLLQIGSYENTYIIDPFPIFDRVMSELKEILESVHCLKVMHGCANDVIALNRDFGINICGVIDVQQVQKEIFDMLFDCVAVGDLSSIGDKNANNVLWRAITEKGRLVDIDTLKKLKTDLIKMEKLVTLYCPQQRLPVDCTLSDWRLRPLDPRMLEYATFDVKALLKVWGLMKKVLLSRNDGDGILMRGLQGTSKLVRKHFTTPPDVTMAKLLSKTKNQPITDPELFEMLFKFRRLHAKIIDENEEEMLRLSELISLAQQKPLTPEDVILLLEKSRRGQIPCESVTSYCKSVAEIIAKRGSFFQELEKKKCHQCHGKYEYPHKAWGCLEHYTLEKKKEWYHLPENKQEAHKYNDLKRARWMRSHPNKPFPLDVYLQSVNKPPVASTSLQAWREQKNVLQPNKQSGVLPVAYPAVTDSIVNISQQQQQIQQSIQQSSVSLMPSNPVPGSSSHARKEQQQVSQSSEQSAVSSVAYPAVTAQKILRVPAVLTFSTRSSAASVATSSQVLQAQQNQAHRNEQGLTRPTALQNVSQQAADLQAVIRIPPGAGSSVPAVIRLGTPVIGRARARGRTPQNAAQSSELVQQLRDLSVAPGHGRGGQSRH